MTEIDYKRLAAEIVREQNKQLLTFNDICAVFGYAQNSSAARKLVNSADFPKWTKLSESGDRRWFKSEVFRWVDRMRDERSATVSAGACAHSVSV